MKMFIGWSSALCLSISLLQAQETNNVERLNAQLKQLEEQQREMQERFQQLMREQQTQIEELKRQLSVTETASAPGSSATVTAASGPQPPAAWSVTDPIRFGRGAAYMDVGLVGTFAAGSSTARDIAGGTQLGGHDPNQRGFTVQGAEVNFAGAVDPYFRGNMNVLFQIDSEGDSLMELEEAWLESIALPGNLQIRAGQFLTDFGRVNVQHPHQWVFVDVPLVNGRFLGPDGLRNPGAHVSWLAPTPFFAQLSLGVQNSHGGTASGFRSAGGHRHGGEEAEDALPLGFRHPDNDRGVGGIEDLLFSPRWTASFDLTDNQTLMLGGSGAFGPNASGASGETLTQIYGVDVYWKWRSASAHAGFPFVSWQTEAMLRRYELGGFDWDENENGLADGGEVVDGTTGLPAVLGRETITDYGFYSQLLYGFRKGWVAGLRYDFLTGNRGRYERMDLMLDGEPLGRDPLRNRRWRLSPNLTWYPSEFSKIRLQYNYDDRAAIGTDHSVWLQFEFLLGAHAAHTF